MSNANLEASLTIKAGVKGLETISKLGNEIESAGVDVSHLREESKELNKTFNELDKKQSLIDNFKEIKKTLKANNTEWQRAKKNVNQLKQAIDEQGSATKKQQAELKKAIAQEQTLKNSRKQHLQTLKKTKDAMSEAGLSSKNLNQQQKELAKSADIAEIQLNQLNDEVAELHKLAQAKIKLGLDVDKKAKQEINEVKNAYKELKQSGTLTKTELARATELYNQKLAGLQGGFDKTNKSAKGLSVGLGGLNSLLATLGVTVGATELLQMADDFKTLEARVKGATGEGANFVTGFKGVKEIANETFTSIEDTGELFARITRASEDMGLAQKEALAVTKTINQSIKLSGGSAESNQQAITQLIQGLQSGVLRGEEFNSVLEQSPRLARAMSEGLGVTIGQLRAMAGEGKLTSKVVIESLQGQADIIQSEFDKIPVTVKNSLLQLKNNFISFFGSIDKELNSSGGLASVIQGISEGIEDIDPATIEAVKSAFTQLGSAVKEIYDLVANVGGAFDDILNAVAGVDKSAEQVNFLTRTVQGLSIAFGAVADVVKGLQITFDLALGGITSALSKFYGGLAKIEILPDDMQAKYQQMSDSLEAMSDKSFARMEKNVNNYSSSTVQALDNASRSQQQILDDAADKARKTYEQMAQDGTVSAGKLEEAFVDYAVKAINANQGVVDERLKAELAEKSLQAVISETGKVTIEHKEIAKQSAQTIKDEMADTAQSLGLDFEQASNKVSQSMQKSVNSVIELANNFDKLETEGFDATNLINQGLQNMQDKVKNKADLEALRQLYTDFGNQGKLSTTQVEAGIDAINQKIAKSPELLDETAKAFQELGIISKAEAEKQAQAQIDAYKKVQASGQASNEQLQEALENMSGKIEASGDTAVQSWYEAEKATQEFGVSVDDVSSRIDNQKQAIKEVEQADNEATRSQVSNASNLHSVILNVTSATKGKINTLQQLGATAEQTKQAYDSIMRSQFFEGQRWATLDHFAQDMNRLNDSIDTQVSGFEKARNKAIEHTQALSSSTVNTHDLTEAKHALRQATDANVQGLIRMDSQTLSNLQSAIDSTEAKLKDLDNTAKDVADSIESALERERGNDKRARDIEQTKELLGLEQKLAEAQARGSNEEIKQYQRAIQLQKELNKERNKKAEKQQQSTSATTSNTSSNTRSKSSSVSQQSATPKVNINIDVSRVASELHDAMQSVFDSSIRKVNEEIKRRAN